MFEVNSNNDNDCDEQFFANPMLLNLAPEDMAKREEEVAGVLRDLDDGHRKLYEKN